MAFVLPTIQGIFNVMETVTFMQFIHEEAIQSCAMGVFMAIRARNYSVAWEGMRLLGDVLIPHLEAVNTALGWASPPTFWCFKDFIAASKMNLATMQDLATVGSKR